MTRLVFTVLMIMALVPPAAAQDRYIFASTPFTDRDEVTAFYTPLTQYLSEEIGTDVSLYIAPDYDDLVAAMQDGRVDFGHFSPNIYTVAKRAMPDLHYLATIQRDRGGQVSASYRSLIITHADSRHESLSDLEDGLFAFTDPDSTSGYVFPMAVLRRRGIEPEDYFRRVLYLKKHDKVLEAVALQRIDAGAVSSLIYGTDPAALSDDNPFRILAESAPIPNPAYAARGDMDPSVKASVAKALAALTMDHPVMQVMREAGFYGSGYEVLSDSLYDGVREANRLVHGVN